MVHTAEYHRQFGRIPVTLALKQAHWAVEARAQHRLAVELSCYDHRNAIPTSAKLHAPTALAAHPSSTPPPSAFESTSLSSLQVRTVSDSTRTRKRRRNGTRQVPVVANYFFFSYTILGRQQNRQKDGCYGPKYKITKAPPG
jgi:hypothetical protein